MEPATKQSMPVDKSPGLQFFESVGRFFIGDSLDINKSNKSPQFVSSIIALTNQFCSYLPLFTRYKQCDFFPPFNRCFFFGWVGDAQWTSFPAGPDGLLCLCILVIIGNMLGRMMRDVGKVNPPKQGLNSIQNKGQLGSR